MRVAHEIRVSKCLQAAGVLTHSLCRGSGTAPDTLLNTDNFTIVERVKPTGNVPAEETLSYNESSQTVIFDPSGDLAKGLCRLTLTPGVSDQGKIDKRPS